MFDAYRIKRDFPILHTNRPELAYLDNAATTQKPAILLETLADYYRWHNANIHRGVYELAAGATQAYEEARATAARFIGAAAPGQVIFTRGTTEGVNLVATSFLRSRLQAGEEVLISAMEHHSNLIPWQALCKEKGANLRVIPMNDRGELILEEYEKLLTPRTRLVALVHISNSLGTINPVAGMVEMARRREIPVLVDGAQSAAHYPVDMQALGADFFVFSGHKVFGPTGIGVLYAREERLREMEPYQFGGEMIRHVTFEETVFADAPHRFEAGTPNIAGAIGLGAALQYIQSLDREKVVAHLDDLLHYATERLLQIEGVRLIGTAERKSAILSFTLGNVHPHDLATILDQDRIAVRAGHHCTQPVMDFFGVPATARASFSIYNTREDVDRLAESLLGVQKIFA